MSFDPSTLRAGLPCNRGDLGNRHIETEMPTSSQAMILKHRHLDEYFTDTQKMTKTEPPCPVSSVDLNELFRLSCRAVGEEFLKRYINSSKAEVGEKLTKALESRKLKVDLHIIPVSVGKLSMREESRENNAHRARPKTSVPVAHSPKEEHSDVRSKSATLTKMGQKQLGVYNGLPEEILSLGFRRPSKRPVVRRQAKSAPVVAKTEACKLHSSEQPESETKSDVDHDIRILIAKSQTEEIVMTQMVSEHPAQDSSSKEQDEDTETCAKYEDLCLPAVSMRKRPAEKQPLTVCFSLRDNESPTHKELKDHIEADTGVKIMRLQYEPLSVRSGDPSVNGRWLATLRNLFDVDTILRKGFYMNGDHMIVKRWNDIVDREYRNYMYLKDVTYEREKWNLPATKHSKKFHKSRK